MRFGQPTSWPLFAISSPYFSLVLADTLLGPKHWDEVNGHSSATEAVIFIFLDDLQRILWAQKRKGNYATELLEWATQHNSAMFSCKLGKLESPLESLSWCRVLLGCFVDFDAFYIEEMEKKQNMAVQTQVSHVFQHSFIHICWVEILM